MFSTMKIIPFLKQLRNLSSGLILDAKSVTKKKAVKTFDLNSVSKRKARKKIFVKKTSDDIESVWLENLNSENLALYRKTSYGTFRKVNFSKLLKRLQQIYPGQLGNTQTTSIKPKLIEEDSSVQKVLPSNGRTRETKPQPESDPPNGSPFMSNYLITHIMEFPLIKSESNSASFDFMKQEHEDFGCIDAQNFPSVSSILNETMSDASRKRLKMWRERMITEMGAESFQKYYKDLLQQGSKFHSFIKTYLEVPDKSLVKIDPDIEGCWKSLQNIISELDDIRLVEESVYHPILLYRGIVDCVASYRGTPCVIEWKKASKVKSALSDTYDAPIQLSAYLGALPWSKNLEVYKGIVVVVYTDGTPAKVHDMALDSCQVYWRDWLRRVQSYWLKKSSLLVEQ